MDYIFGVENHKKATFQQFFVASLMGGVSSILVSSPLDVIKTRIQNRPFDSPESGLSILGNMVKSEGISSFFKGLTPKILMVGPKLIFSFTIAQYLIAKLESR